MLSLVCCACHAPTSAGDGEWAQSHARRVPLRPAPLPPADHPLAMPHSCSALLRLHAALPTALHVARTPQVLYRVLLALQLCLHVRHCALHLAQQHIHPLDALQAGC